jgi:hypothetical protein
MCGPSKRLRWRGKKGDARLVACFRLCRLPVLLWSTARM